MDYLVEKAYGASGLFLIVLSLLNVYFGVGDLRNNYVFMCVGLFLFFDSMNIFFSDQDSILDQRASLPGLGLFVVFMGAVIGFFVEIYAAYLTGVWSGFFVADLSTMTFLDVVNQVIDTTFLYGVLILPAYSIFRILDRVFRAEVMITEEFQGSDRFKYFVHIGLLLLAAPFALLFIDLAPGLRFLMFNMALAGLLLVIEYFRFRQKGEGIIINLFYGDFKKLSAVMTSSLVIGTVMALLNAYFGIWGAENLPLNGFSLLGMPVVMFAVWGLIIAVVASGFELVFNKKLTNLTS